MYRVDPQTGKQKFFERDAVQSVFSALISILIGLVIGTLIVIFVGLKTDQITLQGIADGIKLVYLGIFSTGRDGAGDLTFGFNMVNFGNMLFRATPLILTGLSVAIAFKTGLFNIGAPGQYLFGTCATLSIALGISSDTLPAWLIWIIAFAGGTIAGGLWGAVPGALKAAFNINEVITCIMTNWIAANLVTWFFDGSGFKNVTDAGKIGYIYKTSTNGVATPKIGLDKIFAGSQVNGGIIIAILIAVFVYVLMAKTTFGYELKACGANRFAAKYAGINDKRSIILSMVIAGCLSGAAASLYWLSGNTEFYWSTYQTLPSVGFNGIPVALLAANNPIAVIFTGCFMSVLNIAGLQLKTLTAYNEYIADIIIATIVYLSAFSMLIRLLITGKKKKKKQKEEIAESENVENIGKEEHE